MKHVQLFEQFINESKSGVKNLKTGDKIIIKAPDLVGPGYNTELTFVKYNKLWNWIEAKDSSGKTLKVGLENDPQDEPKEVIKVNEKSGDSYSSGCVMLYFDFPQMNKIHDGIDSNDLYEEEGDRTFGLEDEPHCTLLYGLEDVVTVEQVKEILDQHVFGTCKVYNASLFENDYDVLKFDVKGDSLHACNEALTELPYNNQYPDYHPHMTIAYLKKGTGKKYCDRMDGHEYELVPTHAVFSQPDGTKTKIKINID